MRSHAYWKKKRSDSGSNKGQVSSGSNAKREPILEKSSSVATFVSCESLTGKELQAAPNGNGTEAAGC